MTEFAFSALGTNPHHPVAGNPHDRSRAPGGSSSGAVVSLVDGMAEIAIGSERQRYVQGCAASLRPRPTRP
jgi:aspartyl-tRNA(Asn)/glutamyl-tRNA(Gln) amidotransferase subunit A